MNGFIYRNTNERNFHLNLIESPPCVNKVESSKSRFAHEMLKIACNLIYLQVCGAIHTSC